MVDFKTKFSLKPYNTFGIDVLSEFFIEISSTEDINELIASDIFNSQPRLILGGGSNVLFTRDFKGLVIHPKIVDIQVLEDNQDHVLLQVGSGVVWDDLVEYSVEKDWGGLENLSAIPGLVGASPIQNIGAYGVEVKDMIVEIRGVDLLKNETVTYDNSDCEFAYRSSIFKRKLKNEFLITHVVLQLKKAPHTLITHYGQIEKSLNKYDQKNIAIMREIICAIRNAKLPDVKQFGNAGSFFKNPEVPLEVAEEIVSKYDDVLVYPASDNRSKLSAAWLIEKAGCKGIRIGNAGTHKNQSLVLINLGKAKGAEILVLANHIRSKVYDTFGIQLEEEVNIV